MSRYVVSYTS